MKYKEFISNMLGCWHIILIGRTDLPPIFNDFVLKEHLRLITLNKLNFEMDEIDEYFSMYSLLLAKRR